MGNPSVVITFAIYLLFMLAIGSHFYKKNESLSDYLLGDRQLNKWVAAMSAQASDMSGWLLLGLPGYAYLQGLEAGWIAAGLAVGAKLFEAVFGLPYRSALLIGAAVIISYTALGGFMAVSWTDFFQGIIMFFAIITLPLLAIHAMGGFAASAAAMRQVSPGFMGFFTKGQGGPLAPIAVASLAAWGLGYFGQPHILARFMAIRSPDELAPARKIAMTWVSISLACAVLVGLLGRIYLPETLSGADAEKVFMILVDRLTHPVFGGILLAAVLAAIMSTADSQLLVTSSALTEDLYRVIIRPRASEKELVWVSRGTVVGVAAIACTIAMKPDSSVLDLVAYAWAGFGATFGPLVLLSLYWKRMTLNGAMAGIIGGGTTVLLWKQLEGGVFDLYEIVPGFIVSALLIVLFSLMGSPPASPVMEQFDRATN